MKKISIMLVLLFASLTIMSCSEEEITPSNGGDNGGGGVIYDKIVK